MTTVKYIHTHRDGTACIAIDSRHSLSKMQSFRMKGTLYAIGYMGYTGQWYIFDILTGKEVAQLSREFYEVFIQTVDAQPTKPVPREECLATQEIRV